MEEVVVVPECSPELKPVVGQKFQSLDFAFACYEVYARAVGFETRKQAMRKVDDVTTWYRVVCNREGRKKGDEDDQLNARSGFTIKRRKLSKRCGCMASISFRFFSKDCLSGYIIEEFSESHNHHMVETEHQHFMMSNRKLDDVHHKFILDCSKANIGPTLTFKVLKEILGGFDLVGCTVGDIRNASRDIKAYAQGFDVQMVLDDMAKKKELSEAFTYHYEVNESDQLVALFWCDGLMKQNYHMFGDIVSFDSTYNTNRYCMIFTPFTGKDNHGSPVTFAAGLVCSEKTGAFAWLFRHFVDCMGVAPRMIVTDQDLGMRSAIEEVLVGTHHRWCMWHIMHKLAVKVPNRLLRDDEFKKEFNACVWSDLLEPGEFEEEWNRLIEHHHLEDIDWFNTLYAYRKYWIPAYFRDFPMGSMIRTTSISESENSFYKNFLKPRANIAEFYLNFNHAIEFQRNTRTALDYHDATAIPILATTLPFEKHASTLFTDSMFKKIQQEIVEGNDRCRVLGFMSGETVDTYKLGDSKRNAYVVRHDKTDDTYSCECKMFGRHGYLCSHIFFLFRNNEVKKIPDNYCDNRWMKTPLAKAVHGELQDPVHTQSSSDDRQTVSKQAISMFYGFLRRFETDIDVLRAFVGGVEELGTSLENGTPATSAVEKRRMVEEFYGMVRPESVAVHPPDVVKTKGHASSSASRLISMREKAIKDATRPLRRCKACDEMGHHDSRNCPLLKEMTMEKDARKGKRTA
ncbi:protein FAR1-RELATED SEQUENCE 5-like [Salvia splendens]|uniref:protein FAR1-RELATED SEQUENCE 5-like n=1 Tax=Salvia splendens TaxID=180675 RepID=UPI001C25D446|nr:protein FAR1-RELATED SEQUENCE 5-like [Salvia splendens]